MLSKKNILLSFFILYAVLTFSQKTESKNFTLKWNNHSTVQINKNHSITLPLIENNFFNKHNIPTYTTYFNVKNEVFVQNYKIINVKFSVLPSNLTKNIDLKNLSSEIKSSFQINKARNNTTALLVLDALIKSNGVVKKIESFTLEYVLSSNNSALSKKSAQNINYTSSSVLSNGTWFKFAVDTTGVFKIDRDLLQKIGINASNLDPKNIKIYGNGGAQLPQLNSAFRHDDLQENAIYIEGEQDGVFDSSDFILFYAKGPHSWEINTTDFDRTKHKTNIYSDKAYYFITVDSKPSKRITIQSEITQIADQQISTFHDYLLHEIERVNLFANGQQWLGEDFSFNENQTFSFNFDNINSDQDIYFRVRAAAISFTATQMNVKINGQELFDLNFPVLSSGSFNLATSAEAIQPTNLNTNTIQVELTFNNFGNPSAKAYLDYIEVLGSKNLVAQEKQFSFRNITTTDASKVYEYTIVNNENIQQLWDVSDYVNPKQIENQSTTSTFSFKSFGNTTAKEFIVVNLNDYFIPETIENNSVENQNLHQLKDVDYVIITQDYLKNEAERLAKHHRENSNLNAVVVDLHQIYNEFGSGSPDLTAIRDFIRFLYQTASSNENKIKYVCLFGDSSFDFKDRITDNNNIVPAFQSYESFNLVTSYVTDDYFGIMDDNEGNLSNIDLQDVATGRFPVTSLKEAKEMIDKTLNYYHTNSFGDWRNSITFVADDPDRANEFILQQTVDLIAEEVKTNKPEFNIKKIYADAHQQETSSGGERYPTVNEAITNAVEAGTLMLDYFGHGGVGGWAEERILEVPQIQNWVNFNTLPLFITVTCEFSRFDNPIRPSAGEFTFLNTKGGAVSMISTTREIFISVGQSFNKNLIRKLLNFENQNYTISEALMYTKHDFNSVQRFFIYNFGDPAMKLAQPKANIILTKINGEDILLGEHTLKALSRIKLEGIITDINNNILTDYQGTLSTTIFDKPLNKTTLDNDNFGRKMEFTAIESKVFKGLSSIKNGTFSLEFIVPKDIRIALGNAKISMYAENSNDDKSGYNLDILIGGIDTNAPSDVEGPTIKLFMNDDSFVDGGNTNESPLLYAVLEDISGINTSITAVDHDILAILDDDNANPFILNDFYETELDNFQKGEVKFPFRDLEPGLHHLKFKCWDAYNNPSEASITFIVVNDNDLVLSNVLNYPNPFINYTEFWFNHNKPNETLEVQVQIFTVSGKLIKTINKSVQSEGLLSRDITWNGLDDFGNKIGKGVYIYKLHVKSLVSNAKAEKIEKLVILQ